MDEGCRIRSRRAVAGRTRAPRSPHSSFIIHHSAFSAASPAFTLLELVLVLVIITVVVMMAVPSLRTFGRGRGVDDTATQLVALTGYARAQAISKATPYRLNFDAATRRYYLSVDQGDGTFAELGEEFGRPFTLPESVTFQWDAPQQSDGQYVTFWPTGRTDPSTIVLSDNDRNVVQVACQSPSEIYRILTQQDLAGR